jgi:hypothetical protein
MNRKVLFAVGLIAVIAGVSLIWFTVTPTINYWLDINQSYQATGDHWIPVICTNSGILDGTFNLMVTFTNASFSTTTPQPYQQISSNAVKFTFTLHSSEQRTTNVHFIIDNNTDQFRISLSVESSQPFLRFAPTPMFQYRTADYYGVYDPSIGSYVFLDVVPL